MQEKSFPTVVEIQKLKVIRGEALQETKVPFHPTNSHGVTPIYSKQNLSKLLFNRARQEEDEQSPPKSLITFPLNFIKNTWLFLSLSS